MASCLLGKLFSAPWPPSLQKSCDDPSQWYSSTQGSRWLKRKKRIMASTGLLEPSESHRAYELRMLMKFKFRSCSVHSRIARRRQQDAVVMIRKGGDAVGRRGLHVSSHSRVLTGWNHCQDCIHRACHQISK